MFKPVNEPEEPELFPTDIDVDAAMGRKQEIFGRYFASGFNLEFKSRSQRFEHTVVAQRDGIIVLRLANNTTLTRERGFNRWTEDDQPSLYVLIDNRPGRQIIAIENRKQAFSDTATVANIMEDSLNRLLWHEGLQVGIRSKYHTHEFWNVIAGYENGIACVKFTFPYPNLPAISDLVGEFYKGLAKSTNSAPVTMLNAPTKEKLTLDESNIMLLNMIAAASASGELIKVRPKGQRSFKSIGLNAVVQEELSEQALAGLDEGELIARRWKLIEDFMNRIKLVYH